MAPLKRLIGTLYFFFIYRTLFGSLGASLVALGSILEALFSPASLPGALYLQTLPALFFKSSESVRDIPFWECLVMRMSRTDSLLLKKSAGRVCNFTPLGALWSPASLPRVCFLHTLPTLFFKRSESVRDIPFRECLVTRTSQPKTLVLKKKCRKGLQK